MRRWFWLLPFSFYAVTRRGNAGRWARWIIGWGYSWSYWVAHGSGTTGAESSLALLRTVFTRSHHFGIAVFQFRMLNVLHRLTMSGFGV